MKNTLNRTAGIQELVQLQYGVNFAGSNSKAEYEELEHNLVNLLDKNKFSYTDIENYLVGWGYQAPMIHEIFKKLTGLDPVRLNSTDYLMNMPGNIPGFNYGWGVGKSKKYQYVFVISYKSGYGIFGQIDDINRELIDYVLDLDEAFACLNKEAKDIKTCKDVLHFTDKQLGDAYKKMRTPVELGNTPVVQDITWTGRSAALANIIDSQSKYMQPREIHAMVRMAYDKQEITAQEHESLLDYYMHRVATGGDAVPEESTDLDKLLSNQNMSSAKIETPDDALTDALQDKNVSMQLENIQTAIASIKDYLANNLTDFIGKGTLAVTALSYAKKDDANNVIEKTPEVEGQTPKQYFNKVGFYTVVLSVTLNDYAELGAQEILTVFNINEKGVAETNGKFKGMDKNLYALNYGGISEYFNALNAKENKENE